MTSMTTPRSAASTVGRDVRFEPFRAEDFDAAQFTSRALSDALSSAHTTGQQLREDIKQLENGLCEEVVHKQSQLRGVVDSLSEMEASCYSVDRGVQQLGGSVGELHASLEAPCQTLRLRTRQLKNLRATIDTLRAVSHRLKLVKKLRKRVGEAEGDIHGDDLPEVARIIRELDDSSGADVAGLQFLEEDATYAQRIASRVRSMAEDELLKGQESMNQAEMGNALHVFFNLDELLAAVQMLTSTRVSKFSQRARNAFDFHKLMSGTRAPGQGSLQDGVWSCLQTLVKGLEEDAVSVFQLQQVLAKKHDPVTHVCFLSAIEGGDKLVDKFWLQAVEVLTRTMSHAVQPGKSTPVREVLVQGFPKLCGILEGTVQHLSNKLIVKGKASCLEPQHAHQLLGSCVAVQNVFAARSLAHMTEAVDAVLPAGSRSVPSSADVQKLVSVFHEEMKQAEGSIHTRRLVANNIANAVLSINERVPLLAATGPDLRSFVGSCNGSQLRNMSLFSSLQEIHRSLVVLLTKLEQKGVELLIPACDALKAAALELIAPMFKSFVESLEQFILGMHALPVWLSDSGESGSERQPSRFVNELRSQLRMFSMEFLSRFTPPFSPSSPSFVRSLVQRMACRLIVFYVRHASMIPVLTPSGRQQLMTDALEMEHVISQTLFPVHSLARHAVTLHAFKELVQTSPAQIQGNVAIMELPRVSVLHHLFSRGPPDLKLPHEQIGLTPSQFSYWLDSHSGDEAVSSVRSTLESFDASGLGPEFKELLQVLTELCKQ